jgi:MFS family permease
MTAAIGPVSAVVVDVVRLALRSTAISTMAVVQNLVGLAVGPVLGGWLSDRYGLTTALAVLPLLCVVSAAMFWYGSRFYERDRAAVPVGGAPAPARPQHGQLWPPPWSSAGSRRSSTSSRPSASRCAMWPYSAAQSVTGPTSRVSEPASTALSGSSASISRGVSRPEIRKA